MARWPGSRLSKTNTEMAHTSGYVDKKFQSSSLIVCWLYRAQSQLKVLQAKKDSDFVKIIKMPTEVGILKRITILLQASLIIIIIKRKYRTYKNNKELLSA